MRFLLTIFGLLLISSASAQEKSLFDRNREALDRAEKRNFEPPPRNEGRTGYTERGFQNNTGNDSQSRQLDRLNREPNSRR
jgi:hypothetical protein